MKLGTYTVTVRDRGRDHNAHIVAPGYNRKTAPLSFRGTQTWKVALKRTGTFRFLCDPHAVGRYARLGEDRALDEPTVASRARRWSTPQTERPATRQTGPCVAS